MYTTVFAYFGLFVCLGAHEEVWRALQSILLPLFWLGVPLIVAATVIPGINAVFSSPSAVAISEDRFTWAAGYDIRLVMNMWPLLFLGSLYYRRSRAVIIASRGTILGPPVLTLLYFKNRSDLLGPLVMILLVLLVFARSHSKMFVNAIRVILPAALLAALLYSVPAAWVDDVSERLIPTTGAISSSDLVRLYEAESLLEDLSPVEWIVGKGLGGGFETNAEVGANAYVLRGTRTEVHFGALFPLLEGGLTLSLVLFGSIAVTLAKSFRLLSRRREVGMSWVLLAYFAIVVMVSPFPTLADVYTAMLGGLALGRLRGELRARDARPFVAARQRQTQMAAAR
jgi:hypothetical protein